MAAMAEESEDVDLSQEQTEKLLQFQVCQTELLSFNAFWIDTIPLDWIVYRNTDTNVPIL